MEGIVIKSTGKWYTVRTPDRTHYECSIKGSFRIKGIQSTNPVAVGDHVHFELTQDQKTGRITAIKERNNYLIRRSAKLSKKTHIIAANVDQAILMVTINYPVTYSEFIDRYLASAEAYRIPTIILFNKIDLYDQKDKERLDEWVQLYRSIGYTCIITSADQHIGLDEVQQVLQNKVSVISGNSGVGKSTLINAIDPNINLKTGEISHHYKLGKHITTFPELIELTQGGFIIDTPGIKGFGLVYMDREELFHFFPDIFAYSHECKFHNCLHKDEPGCAVKAAVENREIHPMRYQNYLDILEENENKYR